ncbi:MAG: fibronectin type III domain-containing protein, partial [Bacteroidales bacterium]|nr:fibronectin type III domain-containing protein [Bacteroidales bacterium]
MKASSTLSQANKSGNRTASLLGKCVMLFTIALCALIPAGTRAQTTVTIGTGTTTYNHIPVNNYYNYTWNQIIYTSSELQPGTITSIGFQYSYSSASTVKNNVQIYMATNSKSYFSSTTDYVTSGFTLVYSGNLNCSQGWNDFQLQTPYNYSGSGNLIVAIVDQSGSYNGSSYTFYGTTTSSAMTINYYSDSYYSSSATSPNSSMNSYLRSYRPNTRFTITTSGGGSSSSDCVEVGSASTTNSYLPTYEYYCYSLTQQIYTASEIAAAGGSAGNITSIAFDVSSVGSVTSGRNLDIYLKHTSKTSFSGSSDWESISSSDLVYSGTVQYSSGWITIPLTTPFAYDGSSNLLLCVDDNTGSYVSAASKYVYSATSQAIRVYSDGTNYVATSPTSYSGTVMSYKNNLKLCIEASSSSCEAPSNPTASNIQARTATVSWSGGSGTYDEEYKLSSASTWTRLVSGTSSTSHSFSNLTPNTSYQFRVRSVCNGDESAWRSVTFTTSPLICPDVAVIGGGGSSTHSYLPSTSFYNYGYSQQIYTPCEIGGAGSISSISFYNSGSTQTRTYDIYLKHTNKTQFASSTDWESVSTANRVLYAGSVTLTAGTWTTIYFDTPFEYDGVSNLLVAMDDNTGSYTSTTYFYVYPIDGGLSQAMYVYGDGTNYSPTSISSTSGTTVTSKNQLHFGICDQTPIAGSVTITANASTGGSVSGAGTHTACSNVTLTATPSTCYKFVNWTENGSVVSTSASYTFVAQANRTLVANFTPITLTLSTTPSAISCVDQGTEVTLTASSNVSPSYNWSYTGTAGSASSNTYTVTPAEGTNTYTVSFTYSGCNMSQSKTVTLMPEITTSSSEVGELCLGNSATLSATSALTGNTYQWNNGAGSGASVTVSPTVSTTYTVTATSTGGCSETGTVEVPVNTNVAPGSIGNGEACASDLTAIIPSVAPASGCGVIEYEWHVGEITTARSTNPEGELTASQLATLGAGNHTVTRTFYDEGGNTGTTAPATLTLNPPTSGPTVTGVTELFCGNSTTLTATSTFSGEHLQYRWYSDPNGQNLVCEGNVFQTPAITENTTYYVQVTDEYMDATATDFNYTGAAQTYNIPAHTDYLKLEVWGAQGGGQQTNGNSSAGVGGNGGYSVGNMPVNGGETIYVYVGGEGQESSALAYGGFNGGGTNYGSGSSEPACGGGGATDIRLNGNTLYDRIIVAGGGGGGGEDSGDQGGYGGGESGGAGNAYSYQGTQTAAGTGAVFGIGASAGNDGGAGGGGWYGGGTYGGSQTIPSSYSGSDCNGGSGGSGYVWTAATASYAPAGYNVPASYYLTDGQTIAGNLSFPAPAGGNETGHEGDGHARITAYRYVQAQCPSELTPVNIIALRMPAPVVEVRSACVGEPSELVVTNPEPGYQYQWSTDPNFSQIEFTGTTYTPTVNGSITYYVRSVAGAETETYNFEYTGAVQTYTVPIGVSRARLEVWGAQGGTAPGNTEGGRGGYSVGEMTVSPGMTLNVYVGGQGGYGSNVAGGFNGGGLGYSSNSRTMTSGGGATDIRVNSTSLYSRVIVAGGGGGGYETGVSGDGSTACYGGGLTGGTGSGYSASRYGQGGTQTSGGAAATDQSWGGTVYDGSFGVGGYSVSAGYSNGGGGGWYGGGASTPDGGAGGGSGYVYTSSTASNYPSGCLLNNALYLTDAQTIAGNTAFPAPDGTNETGHTGNGYARITLLDLSSDACPSEVRTVEINPASAPSFTLTASSNAYCAGSSPVVLTAQNPSSSIVSYEWSDGTTTTENTHEVTPGYTTTYTVTASNGTCGVAQSVTISVDAPEVSLSGTDNGACIEAGTEVTIMIAGAGMSGEISVGTMDGSNNVLPLNSCYNYNSSESIYTPAEIGGAGWITSISYYIDSWV